MDQRTGFWSLFQNVNKTAGNNSNETQNDGLVKLYDELEISIKDDELLMLSREYEGSWTSSDAYTRVHSDGDKNEKYWKGKPDKGMAYANNADKTAYSENIVFEAVETFLPLATQKNPDPLVKTDNTPEMQALASKVTSMVSYLADLNGLKLKAQEMVRNWLNRYIGVIKVGWDGDRNEITLKVIDPTCLILDPLGYVEGGRYVGEFIGEKKKDKARFLVNKFPKKKTEIEMACNDKMGSILQYTEWWTPDYVFFTMGSIVLSKAKHPYWNYKQETDSVDEFGQPYKKIIPEKNHFLVREYPYGFLTVFNLQKSPVDEVSLIEQGRVLQDLINERGKQLTKNIRGTNGGLAVSGQFFTKEQAAYVAEAKREGRTIVVPTGKISDAIMTLDTPPLPAYVYESMQDYRERFLDIFGVRGSTPQGTDSEDTVRGKIIQGNQDSSRIGGGVTNHLESTVSYLYNYMLQLIYVLYDTEHVASVVGVNGMSEYVTLQSSDFPLDRKLFIDVQPGSLVPKSPLLERNQAMDLWGAGAIDPLSLNEDLKVSNPEERVERLLKWKFAPQTLMGQDQPTQMTPHDGQATAEGQISPEGDPNVTPEGQPGPTDSQQVLGQVPI